VKARAGGDLPAAAAAFERAVAGAAAHGFVADEGLAHELFADLLRERGEDEAAELHVASARDAYGRWGARAKVARMGDRPA
jgi:hypothetical protein